MERDIRLQWGSVVSKGSGNQFGYFTHNTKLREAVGKQVKLVNSDPTDIIYITSPEYFKGVKTDARTWLFTMFEGTTIPTIYKEQMEKADCLLAPSTWVANLFKKYFLEKPIFIVPHGVSRKFKFKKRRWVGQRPFRFLWIGAPNPRKGYEEISVVWNELFKSSGIAMLYIKTTGPDNWGLNGRAVRKGNVILDGRKITVNQLVKLYQSADCFLFPTRGEGFGLTLAEAMRTGCPCISTYYSGVTDFFDDKVGYIISHKMGKGKITFIGDELEEETEMAFPSPDALAEKMFYVMENYKEALKKAKRASERMKLFTWFRSAKILMEAIKEVNNIAC